MGSLIDCLVLTPERFESTYVITPQYKNEKGELKPWNWNATVCKQFRDEHDGLEIVKFDTFQAAKEAADSLRQAFDEIGMDTVSYRTQVLVRAEYHDKNTKLVVPIKCLIDILPVDGLEKSICDLKTANSAHPAVWKSVVFKFKHRAQAAMYLDAYVAATGEDRCEFRHIVQESFAPWEVAMHLLSEDFLTLGRETYIAALQRYCQCLATNKWPGYESHDRQMIDGWNLIQPEPWMIGV